MKKLFLQFKWKWDRAWWLSTATISWRYTPSCFIFQTINIIDFISPTIKTIAKTVYVRSVSGKLLLNVGYNTNFTFDLHNAAKAVINTAQKMKFSIKDFFRKCDQILNGNIHFLCSETYFLITNKNIKMTWLEKNR